jgi:HSP20 family molecular chaperone IbpA
MGSLVQNGPGARLTQRSPLQGLFGFDPFQAIVSNWDYGFEVNRTEKGYTVEVPVPGFNSSNVEITLKDGIVSVNAKNERRTFSRSFTVPEDVDSEKIAASVTDGMLTITLERHPAAQPRRIAVN